MKKNPILIALILVTFFVISFLTNIIGPLVPDIIKSFGLSLKMASFIPFSFFVAYGVMSIPSGFLIETFGEKKVMILAFMISSIGAFLFASYRLLFLLSCLTFFNWNWNGNASSCNKSIT